MAIEVLAIIRPLTAKDLHLQSDAFVQSYLQYSACIGLEFAIVYQPVYPPGCSIPTATSTTNRNAHFGDSDISLTAGGADAINRRENAMGSIEVTERPGAMVMVA